VRIVAPLTTTFSIDPATEAADSSRSVAEGPPSHGSRSRMSSERRQSRRSASPGRAAQRSSADAMPRKAPVSAAAVRSAGR